MFIVNRIIKGLISSPFFVVHLPLTEFQQMLNFHNSSEKRRFDLPNEQLTIKPMKKFYLTMLSLALAIGGTFAQSKADFGPVSVPPNGS